VIDAYQQQRGQRVDLVSAGDDIDEFLRVRREAGTHPDVAITSRLGFITDFARRGWLVPLDRALFEPRFPPAWNNLLIRGPELYGAWIKGAHKSLLWTRSSTLDRGTPPKTFEGLVDLVRRLAHRRPPAPLAIGAADGWVLTDWFENVLASASPEEYQKLADNTADWHSPTVRSALSRLAELWSIPGAFPDGGARALLTQQEESVIQVVRTNQAAMVVEGDFVYGVAQRFQRPDLVPIQPYDFPAVAGGTKPLVVSGDAAVLLRDNAGARDLVEWLTSRDVWPAFGPWLRDGGYLTPNLTIPDNAYRNSVTLGLVQKARGTDQLQFDLSDQLPAPLSGGDGSGSWKVLQDFFADVTRSTPDIPAAVTRAVDRFATLAARSRP
jgi:hypothetical protein